MAFHEALPHCHGPLIEIDHYGERLIGCIECDTTGREASSGREIELLGTARSVA